MAGVLRVLAVLSLFFACALTVDYSCCCAFDGDQYVLLGPADVTVECLYQHDYFGANYDEEYTGYAQQVDICAYTGVCGNCWCNLVGETGFVDQLQIFGTTPGLTTNTGCNGYSNSGHFTRVFTTSCNGGTVSVSQVVTIQDDVAPELVIPEDMTVECVSTNGAAGYSSEGHYEGFFGSARATDLCTNPTLTENPVVTATSGTCAYTITRTFSSSDGCFTTTKTQTITVLDTTGPEVLLANGVLYYECGNPAIATPPTLPTLVDLCNNAVPASISHSDVVYPGKCTGDYTIARTWSGSDNCATPNVGTATQIIVVKDTLPPSVTVGGSPAVDSYTTVTCSPPVLNLNSYILTDTCASANNLYLTYDQKIDGILDFVNNYDIIRSFTASDDCGNSYSWREVIHVQLTSFVTLTSSVNTQAAVKGALTTVSFTATITNLCKIGYFVFDIGPSVYSSISGLTGCTAGAGGAVICEYTAVPVTVPVAIAVSITFTVPTTYQPQSLEIQASFIEGGVSDTNREGSQSTTLLTF